MPSTQDELLTAIEAGEADRVRAALAAHGGNPSVVAMIDAERRRRGQASSNE